jgi:chemotaxis protein histidine kinase CheA
MHLITIQKSLKSIELAMRQQIDFSWLIHKITGQISVLKLEAETISEEQLAGVAGQVEAFFETVSDGRLDFDEKSLAIILEFTNIYKDTLGDAVSETSSNHRLRLDAWNKCYQGLMADMRPSFEARPIRVRPFEPPPPPEPDNTQIGSTLEPSELELYDEEPEELASVLDIDPVKLPSQVDREPDYVADEDVEEPEPDYVADDDISDDPEPWSPGDDIPVYDQGLDGYYSRDVVISDSETISARECLEMEESQADDADCVGVAESEEPVRFQELSDLKAQLSELHEEQEQISSTMSEILDAQALDSDQVPFDMLDEQGLEDIIFISREKG